MTAVSMLALALAVSPSTHAGEAPLYRPEPAWVQPVPIPSGMKPTGGATDVLLMTVQGHYAPDGQEQFTEVAARINAPEGLSQIGSLVETWNPLTETLAIHRAQILRGGKVIDLLAGGHRFAVLRREASLEAAMIDGTLTATLQPEGLQVGDVLDVAVTTTRREPALAGHSEAAIGVGHTGAIGRLVLAASWPTGAAFRTWKTDDLALSAPAIHGAWTTVGLDRTDDVSPQPPRGAMRRDQLFGGLMLADFKDWTAVSATSYPLYAKAAALAPGSPLEIEITRIRAASADPKARALAALRVVQDQTRYLYVGLDAGGYTPAAADLTWTRRFGDCKGKTVLLLALLHGLGIAAEPALVNTTGGDGMDQRPPMLGAFNHVLVRTELGGGVYWLDGTRRGDENLDILPTPDFHWALPLRAGGASLEPLTPKPPLLPISDVSVRVDARAGVDKPARVHAEFILRGDGGRLFALAIRRVTAADADRALRDVFVSQRSWIKPDKVSFTYDPQTMEARGLLEGSGVTPFTGADEAVRDWQIEGSSVGYAADFTRTSDYHRDAPYAVDHPAFQRTIVEVDLPDHGRGFTLLNDGAVDRVVGGVVYTRTAKMRDGHLIMAASQRSVASSFPAAEAATVQRALLDLSSYDVSVRYRRSNAGARVAATASKTDTGEPNDPAAAYARGDYVAAETGFTTALAAAPTAKLFYDRAAARAARGEDALAQADLEAALHMDPTDAFAAFGLGRMALRHADLTQAATRFAAAISSAAEPSAMAKLIADAYERADRFAEAVPYRDRATQDAASTPEAQARAANARCWTRAEAGVELARAMTECDAALAATPTSGPALDSRGLVEFRMGAFTKSIDDYTAALALNPRRVDSLFGRSLAEVRLGKASEAKSDADAAVALEPEIAARFARWGLKP